MKKTFIAPLSLASLLVFAACSSSHTSTSEPLTEVDVAEVTTDSVVLYKEYPGTLSAVSAVDLVARVDGYLRTQNYEAGETVEKGRVLFTIEQDQYIDAVNRAKAALQTAKSANEYAVQQYAAMKKALESDAVSQMEVLQSKSNLEQSEANIKSAQAALQTALTNLGYCTVRAPFRGTVTASGPSVGAFVGGSASPVALAKIYDNSRLFANFYIEDGSLLRMFMNDNNRSMIDYDPFRFLSASPFRTPTRLPLIIWPPM